MTNLYRFYGIKPKTKEVNYFDFNKPVEGKRNIVMWNSLLDSYLFSQDAGLTWNKIYGKRPFDFPYDLYLKIDVLVFPIEEIKKTAEDRLQKLRLSYGKIKYKKHIGKGEVEIWLWDAVLKNMGGEGAFAQ